MRRFFVDQQSISENLGILSPAESHHVASVLRLHAGDAIELFDGTGIIYQGQILTVSPRKTTVEILYRYDASSESIPQLHLFQGLLKGKKMDFLVQKATELGVHSFHPVQSRFTENHGNLQRQAERWHRIMLEACKQCRRPHPMIIKPPSPFDEIDVSGCNQPVVLWEGERSTPLDATLISYDSPMALFIGPEGGFHQDEIDHAVALGFQPVSLGKRILRAETAALAAISIFQYLCGALALGHG